jgi:hypothetical protein
MYFLPFDLRKLADAVFVTVVGFLVARALECHPLAIKIATLYGVGGLTRVVTIINGIKIIRLSGLLGLSELSGFKGTHSLRLLGELGSH